MSAESQSERSRQLPPHVFKILPDPSDSNLDANDSSPSRSKPLAIVHMACAGTGADEQRTVANKIAKQIQELEGKGFRCLIIYAGDGFYKKNSDYNGVSSANDVKFYTHFYDIYRIVKSTVGHIVPFFFCPGNHEYGIVRGSRTINFSSVNHLITHTQKFYAKMGIELTPNQDGQIELTLAKLPEFNMPHQYYALITDKQLIVMLDTNLLVNDYYLFTSTAGTKTTNNQAAWLVALLSADIIGQRQLILVGHHPIQSDGKTRSNKLPLIEEGEVDQYLDIPDTRERKRVSQALCQEFKTNEYNDMCGQVIHALVLHAMDAMLLNQKLNLKQRTKITSSLGSNASVLQLSLTELKQLAPGEIKFIGDADTDTKVLAVLKQLGFIYFTAHDHFMQLKQLSQLFAKLQLQVSSGGDLQHQKKYSSPSITIEASGFNVYLQLGKHQELTLVSLTQNPLHLELSSWKMLPNPADFVLDSRQHLLANILTYCYQKQLTETNENRLRLYSVVVANIHGAFFDDQVSARELIAASGKQHGIVTATVIHELLKEFRLIGQSTATIITVMGAIHVAGSPPPSLTTSTYTSETTETTHSSPLNSLRSDSLRSDSLRSESLRSESPSPPPASPGRGSTDNIPESIFDT